MFHMHRTTYENQNIYAAAGCHLAVDNSSTLQSLNLSMLKGLLAPGNHCYKRDHERCEFEHCGKGCRHASLFGFMSVI